jgi:ABC-type molybdenum transport system ATPase subunit/photorepair protein PhrA
MRPALVELQNVTIYRGDRLALDRLNLSIHDGEHVAILGPNGCGKSTLIKTLTRELYPYRGHGPFTLRIMGADTWDLFELRAMLGIVTHELIASCTRHLTGRETILSGFFSLREIVRKIAQAGTTIVLVTHHLPDIIPEIERVIMLDGGRLAQDGPKGDVLTSATLSKLFGLPLELVERDGYFQLW